MKVYSTLLILFAIIALASAAPVPEDGEQNQNGKPDGKQQESPEKNSETGKDTKTESKPTDETSKKSHAKAGQKATEEAGENATKNAGKKSFGRTLGTPFRAVGRGWTKMHPAGKWSLATLGVTGGAAAVGAAGWYGRGYWEQKKKEKEALLAEEEAESPSFARTEKEKPQLEAIVSGADNSDFATRD